MEKYSFLILLGVCSLTLAQDIFQILHPSKDDKKSDDSGLAIKLPYILVESPEGSGNYIKEDLTGSPNKSLPIEEKDVKFFLYTKNINGTQFDKNTVSALDFDATKETIFVTHGWRNSHLSPMPQTVKDGYLQNHDVNVVVVGWNEIAKRNYIDARFAVSKVGKIIAKLVKFMMKTVGLQLNNTALVGHSLGAHVSGVAGHNLNGSVDHLVGLDPAGPLFYLIRTGDKLDSSDAKFVQVIHSCAGLLGYPFQLGDADYWPNGGLPIQPGCGIDIAGACAHSRSYEYYAESLTNGRFLANKCGNLITYNLGICSSNTAAIMGNDAIDRSTGNFFLTTNSDVPYAKSSSV